MSLSPIQKQITFFATKDLSRTADFYERVLGLALWLDQGDCRIYEVAGSALLGFCRRDNAPESLPGVILCLVTEDVDAWFEQLRQQGVPFDKPPTHHPDYHIYHCFVRDPNGYLIEIQRFE